MYFKKVFLYANVVGYILAPIGFKDLLVQFSISKYFSFSRHYSTTKSILFLNIQSKGEGWGQPVAQIKTHKLSNWMGNIGGIWQKFSFTIHHTEIWFHFWSKHSEVSKSMFFKTKKMSWYRFVQSFGANT